MKTFDCCEQCGNRFSAPYTPLASKICDTCLGIKEEDDFLITREEIIEEIEKGSNYLSNYVIGESLIIEHIMTDENQILIDEIDWNDNIVVILRKVEIPDE